MESVSIRTQGVAAASDGRPVVIPPRLPYAPAGSGSSADTGEHGSIQASDVGTGRLQDRALLPARRSFASFLASTTCYDALPSSSKVVVFDVGVPLRLAFYALVENEVTAAPLWDSSRGEFAGMVTVTDFSQILLEYHKRGTVGSSSAAQALNKHTLASWKRFYRYKAEEMRSSSRAADGAPLPVWDYPHGLVQIAPENTLLDAVRLLATNSIHRVAVVPIDPAGGAEEEEDADDAEVQAVAAAASREGSSPSVGSDNAMGAASMGGPGGGHVASTDGASNGTPGGILAPGDRSGETVGQLARRLARQREERRGRGRGVASAVAMGEGKAYDGGREKVSDPRVPPARASVRSAREGLLHAPPARTMALGLLTYGTVLEHLAERFKSTAALAGLDTPVGQSGVGVWGEERVITCTTETPLVDVLKVVAERRLAAVPLVDPASGVLVDLWSRDDVLFLATDPGLTVLDAPVRRTRRAYVAASGGVTALRVCRPTDTLRAVVDTFTATRCYCVVGVDPAGKPCGMVTLSDLFRFCIGPHAPIPVASHGGSIRGSEGRSMSDHEVSVTDAASDSSRTSAPSRVQDSGRDAGGFEGQAQMDA